MQVGESGSIEEKYYSSLEFFRDKIVVSFGVIACYELSNEAGTEELCSQHHEYEREIEVYRFGEVKIERCRVHGYDFQNNYHQDSNESD